VRPRLGNHVELWPIDVGWDHFAVNNLNYHGMDMTIVWNGDGHYAGVPTGYSLYVDGARVFTVDRLAHVIWNSRTGRVMVRPRDSANVLFEAARSIPPAARVRLGGNERMVDMLQKAGRDISAETGNAENLAEGRPVSASFTTASPALRATAPEFAVDGWTVSGLPADGPQGQAQPGYLSPNPIWGTEGSPNAEDWLEVNLGSPQAIDNIKLYFFSDKEYNPQQNSDGGNYREPAIYRLQYHDGSDWVNIWGHRSSERPLPNLNEVAFPPVTTDRVRVLVNPYDGFGVGLKEIQIFNTGIDVEPLTAPQVFALASPTSGFEPLTVQFTGFAEDPQGGAITVEWDFGDGQTSTELSPEHTYTEPGSYTATLTATDSDGETGVATVDIEVALFDGNVAVFATATCSVTSPWENCQGINTGVDPTTSNPGIGVGWGTWPNGGTQWMQLDWDEPITTDRTEVYWYQDSPDGSNSGVKRPATWILQYWDDTAQDWVDVSNPSGFGTELNQYNVTTHDAVTTAAMRVTVETRADADAVGALQWKVFEPEGP
jgi:PKD repeat protein